MGTFNTIPHFKFWCQKVLPLVYDDSLSYYELLCKVIVYLNHIIDDVNQIPSIINELISEDKIEEVMTELLDDLREQIARANEGTNTTASYDRNKNELVWLDGTLVRMTRDILAGDRYIEEVDPNDDITGNYVKTSIEIEINRVVEKVQPAIDEIITTIGDLTDLTTSDKTSIVNAINEVVSVIGALTDLDTTDKSSVVNAINEIVSSVATSVETINTTIGDLTDLDTTDKTSVVNAINEIVENIDDVSEKVNNFGWINVKDYGAKGDGVTDDTQALQSVFSTYTDHTIYFPTGVYLIKDTLTGTDINLIGDGQQTSILLFKNGNVTDLNGIIINQLNEENFSDCVTIHDLSICCDSVGTTALNVKGDFLGDRWQISPIIFNVYIGQYEASAFTTGWKNGIIIENCNGASIHDCSIKGCINTAEPSYRGGWGIKIESDKEPHGTDFMLNNNMISLFEIGIRLNVFEGVSLSNSRLVGVNYGLYVTSQLPYPLLIISGTHINASRECVHASNIKEFISTGSDYYCQLGTDSNVWGLKLTGVTYSNINGNSFNNLTSSNMFGIELGGTSNKNNISGNIFHNQADGTMVYSMSLGPSTSNNLVIGNILDGHAINDSGTSNTKVNNI